MALAQAEKLSTRYYSFSSQIMAEQQGYYEILEKCPKGDLDITSWLLWFLGYFERAISGSDLLIGKVLQKAREKRSPNAAAKSSIACLMPDKVLLKEVGDIVHRQHQDVEGVIANYSEEKLKKEDRPAFVEMVKKEIKHLHIGIIARYRIKPSEFTAW